MLEDGDPNRTGDSLVGKLGLAVALAGVLVQVVAVLPALRKLDGEMALLRTQQDSIELSNQQLTATFDYSYLVITSDNTSVIDGSAREGSAARPGTLPPVSPDFSAGGVRPHIPGQGGQHDDAQGEVVRSEEDVTNYIYSSAECSCSELQLLFEQGALPDGVQYQYLAIHQEGQTTAVDVKLTMGAYAVGQLQFGSIIDLNDPPPPLRTVDVSLEAIGEHEGRLIPLFTSTYLYSGGDVDLENFLYETNIGIAYLPIEISYLPPGR